MISAAIVGFSDRHGVVSEVDIAVVACRVSIRYREMKVGSLQKSAKQSVESIRAARKGVHIFGHIEKDLPELWNSYGCAVVVGASDIEAWSVIPEGLTIFLLAPGGTKSPKRQDSYAKISQLVKISFVIGHFVIYKKTRDDEKQHLTNDIDGAGTDFLEDVF